MIPVYQTADRSGHWDSVLASLASLIEVPLTEMPVLSAELVHATVTSDWGPWWHALDGALKARGFFPAQLPAEVVPLGFVVAIGESALRPGERRACVYRDGRLVHDPASGEGLLVVDYYLTLLPIAAPAEVVHTCAANCPHVIRLGHAFCGKHYGQIPPALRRRLKLAQIDRGSVEYRDALGACLHSLRMGELRAAKGKARARQDWKPRETRAAGRDPRTARRVDRATLRGFNGGLERGTE